VSILVANGLTHWFGSEVALESVDLTIDTGEHMAVLGENGAGKTTLLRILATAARPTSGRLEIMGLNALRERRRLRRRIGFVAHAPGLYPALSAAENLDFFCTLQGVDRSRVAETFHWLEFDLFARWQRAALSCASREPQCGGRG